MENTSAPYHFDLANGKSPVDVQGVFKAVLRSNFDAPGFALLDLGTGRSPREIRQFMVNMKAQLSAMLQHASGRPLHYLSMGRFDQQVTTKFHLDGAPEESVLMLGYEPTPIHSRLFMADYAACAHANGISPKDFLRDFNPMFTLGAEKLNGFVTELREFNHQNYNVVLINNSSASFSAGMQGVMHKAEVPSPDLARQRIVNSTMIFVADANQPEPISRVAQEEFVASDLVSPRLA